MAGKLAFVLALATWTSPSTLGIYALAVSIVTMLISLMGAEIHTFTTREIVSASSIEERAMHFRNHFQVLFTLFFLSVPVAYIAILFLGISQNFLFYLLVWVMLGEAVCQELGRYLIVLSRPVASNVLQFIRGAGWMPAAILFFPYMDQGSKVLNLVFLTWGAGCMCAALFGAWHLKVLFVKCGTFRLSWLFKAMSSARHYLVVVLLSHIQVYSDRFIVQYYLGEVQVGILSFYQNFANTLLGFVQAGVISVLLPQLLKAVEARETTEVGLVLKRMMRGALTVALVGAVVLACLVPVLVGYLNTSLYSDDISILYWLLLGNVFLVAALVPHFQLYAYRRDFLLMYVMVGIVVVSVGTNLLVVPRLGLKGAVVVFLLSAIAQFVVKMFLARRAN